MNLRTHFLLPELEAFGPAASEPSRKMAQSHGSSSFVMPLEGSGSVARPFCCRAGAWWPTPACEGPWLATICTVLLPGGCSGQQLPTQPQNGPKSWLLFFCDAIGGVWKCCSSFLLSGRRMVANPSPTRPFSYVRTRVSWRVFGPAASKGPQNDPKSWLLFFCDAIGGVWKCCSSFLLSGRRMVANPSL